MITGCLQQKNGFYYAVLYLKVNGRRRCKWVRRKPLSGMALRTAPRIKCKKNRLKTDYTKHPFGPKHRKESSL